MGMKYYHITGWMYGEYEGNCGSFPSEYVQPIIGLRATKDAIEVYSQSFMYFII